MIRIARLTSCQLPPRSWPAALLVLC